MAKRAAEQSAGKCSTQFRVFPRKSIKLLAESVGVCGLSNEGSGLLAEDISYRVRQVVQSATEFTKHSKRDHVSGDDINRALFWSRVEPIYGYGSKNSNLFSSIATKDGDIFYHEDKEVNLRELAFSKGLPALNELGDPQSKISVEVSLLDKAKSTSTHGLSDVSELSNFDSLSEAYKTYYNQVTRNILEADQDVVKVILADIKTNPRIQVFLPFFVNFISTGIKLLIGNFEKVLRLLEFVKTLMNNRNLYLEPWVVQFVRAVMYCVVEKHPKQTSSSTCDEWTLRNRAIQVLCHIDRKCSNSANYLHHQLVRTFKDIYEDKGRAVHSQYGAIIGIFMLGVDAVEQTVLPHFKIYAEHLETSRQNDPFETTELDYVMHALMCNLLAVFRNKLRHLVDVAAKKGETEQSKSQNSSDTEVFHRVANHAKLNKDIASWYQDGYDLFGDAFVLQVGRLEDFKTTVHRSPPPTPVNTAPLRRLHSQLSNFPYIRNLIKQAVAKTAAITVLEDSSSLPIKRRRLANEEFQTFGDMAFEQVPRLEFLSSNESELRFDNLVTRSRSSRNKNTFNWKYSIAKTKRSTSSTSRKPKLPFSLSFL